MSNENEIDLGKEAAASSANQFNASASGPEIIDVADTVPVPCNIRNDLIQHESQHKDRPGVESMAGDGVIAAPIPANQNAIFVQHERDASEMKSKLNPAAGAAAIESTTESSIIAGSLEITPVLQQTIDKSTEIRLPSLNNRTTNPTVLTAQTSPLTEAYSNSATGDIIIPEATLVPDQDTIPRASVVHPERNSFTIMGKKISPHFMAAMSMIVLITVISSSVVLTQRNMGPGLNAPSYAPSISSYPTSTPSIEPSSSPTSVVYSQLLNIITENTGLNESSFSDTKSTKRIALHWFANDIQSSQALNKSPNFIYSDVEICERFTMALLYYDTRGDEWFDSFQFLSPDHVCKWRAKRGLLKKGVIKCTQDNRVTELALFDNNLKGVLPLEVSLLSELTVFNVGMNDLSSPLPPLENLLNLTEVIINSNDFDGIMPSFESSTRVQTLDFSNNELRGTLFNVDKLPELKTFKISGNALTGEVPPSFQYLDLETLHIHQNGLSGNVDFLCPNLPMNFDLDCFDDDARLSVWSDPDYEATATINITEANEGFTWQVSQSSNWTLELLFAGGQYEPGENLVVTHTMCLPAPGDYLFSTEFNGTEEQLGYFSIGQNVIPLQSNWGTGQWSQFSIDSDGFPYNVPTPYPTSSPETITPTTTLQPTSNSTLWATPTVGTNRTLSPTAILSMITRPPYANLEYSSYSPTAPVTYVPAQSCLNFNIKLTTDAFGEETSYYIYKKNNTSVVSQTSFESNSTYDQDECLDPNECYYFMIVDEFDDGICCDSGLGNYTISLNGKMIGQGGEFTSSETIQIGGCCVPEPEDDACQEGYTLLNVTVKTDFGGSWENSWGLYSNSINQTVAVNKYELSADALSELTCVIEDSCYEFWISDTARDGWIFDDDAFWLVQFGDDVVGKGSGNFGNEDNVSFGSNC